MRKLIVILFLTCSSAFATLNFSKWNEDGRTFIGTDGGINYYTMFASAATGWTDTNNPVAIYYMQDTNGATAIVDSSGNSNDGTPEPSVATGPTYTNLGARTSASGDEIARYFDGTDDYIDCGNITQLAGVTGLTISAWVNIDNVFGSKMIANKWNGRSPVEWGFRLANDHPRFFTQAGGNNTFFTFLDLTLTATNWHHVVATYDNVTMRGYLDGVESSTSQAKAGPLNTTTDPVHIGALDGSEVMGGMMDDVRLYDKALSLAQINEIYTNTIHALGSIETRLTP